MQRAKSQVLRAAERLEGAAGWWDPSLVPCESDLRSEEALTACEKSQSSGPPEVAFGFLLSMISGLWHTDYSRSPWGRRHRKL